jgi:tRNA(Ile2) C34 agmatinyltransferase TiaS
MSCEHLWKCYRRDKLTTDEGTKVLLFFRCKLCGYKFESDDFEDDEKDYLEKGVYEDF